MLPAAEAATRVWPSAICTGSLQACIDGAAAGDRVEVDWLAPIEEDIAISRALTLTAAGQRIRFAGGRSVTGQLGSGVSGTVAISRIDLSDAELSLRKSGAGLAVFVVEDVHVERSLTGGNGRIAVTADSGGTVSATLSGNRVRGLPSSINGGLLELTASGGSLDAWVTGNALTRNADPLAQGAAVFVDAHAIGGQPGEATVRVFGNTAEGAFGRGAYTFSEGLFSSTPSMLRVFALSNAATGSAPATSTGVSLIAGSGTIDAHVFNNTLVGVRNGISATRWDSGAATARVNGSIRNNLIQASERGLVATAALTPSLDNDYNLIEAPANLATPGPNTLAGPARLVARHAPRLRAGSPAIDAGDGTGLANVIVEAGLPPLDADGLRRVKGIRVDVGAYEWGDLGGRHAATLDTIESNWTLLGGPLGTPFTAELQATRVYNYGGRTVAPFGLYYTAGTWALYNESVAPVLPGLLWSVWSPASGTGRFSHTTTSANTTAWRTRIDDGATNGQPGRIVLVAHNWTASPVSNYIDHPLGVYYDGSGAAGRWHIANLGQVALPLNSAFNVYAQPPSPNAFRVAAIPGRQLVVLDHPLLNGIRCANAQVTRVTSAANPGPAGGFDLDYGLVDGHWGIFSPTPWPADTAFNVVVDPAQVFECTDRIFADDLD
ncbi:MAG: hypothetical protein DI564_05695 [Rhodanobacter denitrificans]|uniref:DUF7452 domain-containing protein n=1 Tax=Rhodanobacter denitrificans TaxID=666685 RepID=A0A2W5KJL7_9GAMM|nr:MAG: hypothetical protein DI564_05695 [Rhodanobacter denitrificans]